MLNLNFNTGEILLTINDDPNRVLKFNPKEPGLRKKFYDIVEDLKNGDKVKEIASKAEQLDRECKKAENEAALVDKGDLFYKELDEYIRSKIDCIFGDNASYIIFGDLNVATITDAAEGRTVAQNFLEAILPYFNTETTKNIQKYTQKYKKHRNRRR